MLRRGSTRLARCGAGRPGAATTPITFPPARVTLRANLERYAALEIAGISIGSNDLTPARRRRDSELLADWLDERAPAITDYLEQLIAQARALRLLDAMRGAR
ncbi:MAG: hypothetical protein ACR2NB_08650 [Solirubrobacteraceae bacterium]